MNSTWSVMTLACALVALAPDAASQDTVTAPHAALIKQAGEYSFTEGPTADATGNVYFTDQPNNRILRWDAGTARISTYLQPAGRANGMCFDAQGNLLVCADEKSELWQIPAASVAQGNADDKQVLAGEFRGKRLNGPNDVWCHPDGSLYFTDPFYKRSWWTHEQMPQDGQHVYRLGADHRTLTRVVDTLKQPNGIVGTPDGKTLYVADIGDRKTYRFTIQPDGSLADRTLICDLGSDGMTLDAEGNLYLTGRGVTVFSPQGKQLDRIVVPDENWTANVCFGGSDRHTLLITASKGFYSIPMRVRGASKLGK